MEGRRLEDPAQVETLELLKITAGVSRIERSKRIPSRTRARTHAHAWTLALFFLRISLSPHFSLCWRAGWRLLGDSEKPQLLAPIRRDLGPQRRLIIGPRLYRLQQFRARMAKRESG